MGTREERIQSIAKARGLDWTSILPNIQVLLPIMITACHNDEI